MKSRPRLLQWSLSSFFVFVTFIADLAPLGWDRYHSGYEISADFLGPLTSCTNDNWHPNPDDIIFNIEKQTDFGQKLVPPGSSIISVRVREHDRYVAVIKVPLIGWTEDRHTIFRCGIQGRDQNGEKFFRIRFVDSHHYYMLDDADSGVASTDDKIAK